MHSKSNVENEFKETKKGHRKPKRWCMVKVLWGFPGGSNSKGSAFGARVTGLIPG